MKTRNRESRHFLSLPIMSSEQLSLMQSFLDNYDTVDFEIGLNEDFDVILAVFFKPFVFLF